MDSKKIKPKKASKPKTKERSQQRLRVFYAVTISVPFLFFILLELGLRAGNYMGDLELFSDPGIENEAYLLPNPNFAARYFFYTKTVPSPSIDVFKQEKSPNSFRVFAMGGSSAAGYPYGFNGTFSRVVKDILQDYMPDREVEVVNVGISAISSYTLFDQVEEILEHEPDAIMIYAGHNEFYGALGVGSNENLGGFPWFVRGYLKLQQFKTFLLLRNALVSSGRWISERVSDDQVDPMATLMERIINSRSIPLDGPKHQLAMHQFESNMKAIMEEFQSAGVPVWMGSLASNYKDQPPFVDVEDESLPAANQIYQDAQKRYQEGEMEQAQQLFAYAKDLDGLKFRAPESINTLINEISREYPHVRYVPVFEHFTQESPHGIIGDELMLEHLHPNTRGYFLIGRAFAQSMLLDAELGIENTESARDLNQFQKYESSMYISEFDHRIAYHRVRTLKQGFPFVLGKKPTPYQNTYRPINAADSLAFLAVHSRMNWDEGKVELGSYYESTNEPEKAFLEYMGLVRNQPWNDSPYIFAARIRLNENDFDAAEPLLEQAYAIEPTDAYATKMLGAIMVQKGNLDRGIQLLEESRAIIPNDPQMLYNLSGAYGLNKQYQKAMEIAKEVVAINPNFPGIQQWMAQLSRALN
jgi:tetratricopeptide (TPR) repeat protein